MTDKTNDSRVVLTLDAGGTNFVFSAIKDNKLIVEPVSLKSNAEKLDLCLNTIVKGFRMVQKELTEPAVAISFAFPGPADYPRGIIGGFLPNFPSFRDGVALGPFIEKQFGIPVFINNDADLFAYGEAMVGKLPEINERLKKSGSVKAYKNLLGFTFGTGFGFGFVSDGRLHIGDNSCVEVFCLPHRDNYDLLVEDGVAIRAVKRVYAELSGDKHTVLEPKDIFDIAEGRREGDIEAARQSFDKLGEVAGAAIATAVTMIDGLVVIGGGITGAKKYIMPALLREMRSKIHTLGGETLNRVQMNVYDLDDDEQFIQFAKGQSRKLKVFGCDDEVIYDPEKKVGVSISTLGASKAISIGAAAYALNMIDD
jgi:glucokinase